LLKKKDLYDVDGPIKIAEDFNKLYNKEQTRNSVVKIKARLSKYGIWNNNIPKLDSVEQLIKETGKDVISNIGVREWCRNISVKMNTSASGIKVKYTIMAKYGII